ncbi:PadR family transcriptional regulator [Sporosarcina gallistercoris]|uniref:Helix-turn-helix transcriptional regulator n=1 Tax=Sporosarcina gallistercoris TaxID=2762245 RepID=A0ABR8PHT6_9BACL|nr:helix-turn-helix transcriptional regulator [Sporosarcina gallistercoris]MBD7907740.1 helix-turn-helix transcriptional regulator [Sporosarcina gallistercoris]
MSIQVFILSKLMVGKTYPYELKKQMSEPIPLDELGGITESKLYYHFDALSKQGLIEPVEIIKEEHRPDKQVFAITAKGREELPNKIYKLFKSANDLNDMVIALANIKYVDSEIVVTLLKEKLTNYKAHWERIMNFDNTSPRDEKSENLNDLLVGYFTTKSDHTIHWLEEAIRQIEQGNL